MDAEVVFSPSGLRGSVPLGTTVLDAARMLGVDLDSVCGGRGICGRCQVIPARRAVLGEWSATEANYAGRRPIDANGRLGCSALIAGDATIEVPPQSQLHRPVIRKAIDLTNLVIDPVVRLYYAELETPVLGDDRSELRRLIDALTETFGLASLTIDPIPLRSLQPALAENEHRGVTVAVHHDAHIIAVWSGFVEVAYGVAIDVGSTTLAGHLCDLATGEVIATAGLMNPQIRFGEDLMSRVSYVMMHPTGARELTNSVRDALNKLVATLTDSVGVRPDRICDVVIVANPIMHHLLLGIDPTPLGTAPFTLATDLPYDARAADIELDCDVAQLHMLPCIAGHVGADTAAMVLAVGPHRSDDLMLLIDVGTNAEIVLGNSKQLFAASSPTGPAFEGAQLSCGQRATPGAIERVRINRETLEPDVSTIGDASVTGVCGSGIIETIGELFLAGVIAADGTIDGGAATRSRRVVADGRTFAYVLREEHPRLLITQNDVRAIQLAKAALHAGVKLLLDRAGISEVTSVRLAGAFGSHIDPVYALLLGLIPDCDPNTVRSVGNAAGSGAVWALLSGAARVEIAEVARSIVKIETALEPAFQTHFIDAMGFPHSTDAYPRLAKVVTFPRPSTTNDGRRRRQRRMHNMQTQEDA